MFGSVCASLPFFEPAQPSRLALAKAIVVVVGWSALLELLWANQMSVCAIVTEESMICFGFQEFSFAKAGDPTHLLDRRKTINASGYDGRARYYGSGNRNPLFLSNREQETPFSNRDVISPRQQSNETIRIRFDTRYLTAAILCSSLAFSNGVPMGPSSTFSRIDMGIGPVSTTQVRSVTAAT